MLVSVSLLFINYSVKLKGRSTQGGIHNTYFQRCAIFNPIHIVNKPSTAWHNLDAWFIEDEIAK